MHNFYQEMQVSVHVWAVNYCKKKAARRGSMIVLTFWYSSFCFKLRVSNLCIGGPGACHLESRTLKQKIRHREIGQNWNNLIVKM
jgi:hypothetical protein